MGVDIIAAANAQLGIWENQLMNGEGLNLVEVRGKIKGLKEFTDNVLAAAQQQVQQENSSERNSGEDNSIPQAEAGDESESEKEEAATQ